MKPSDCPNPPASHEPPRILHIIAGLDRGGAEIALLRLLSHPSARAFHHHVLALTADSALRREFEAVAEEVNDLGLRRGLAASWSFPQLVRAARRSRPHLLVGWMYHGNIAASMVRRFLPRGGGGRVPGKVPGKVPVVWNVRHSADDLRGEKRLTAALVRAGRWLAPGTARIVFNSRPSARGHAELGYSLDQAEVIPNGFDCQEFRPRPEARQWLREELGIPLETLVIGRIGRFHPVKEYPGLLAAAGRLDPHLHWLLVGKGLTPANQELSRSIVSNGLEGRCHLWGERDDLPQIVAGLDLMVSNSRSEGFPNVVAEAMASEVPCVVTAVGESEEIVGETGRVVPPRDPEALVEALDSLVALPRVELSRLGRAARERIQRKYTADAVYPLHVELWRRCLEEARGRTAG